MKCKMCGAEYHDHHDCVPALKQENKELRAKLEETQERPFDLEYFLQQAVGDDVAVEIIEYIKWLERKNELSGKTGEQMRAEINELTDLPNDKEELIDINDLANRCGYFRLIEDGDRYGCFHPLGEDEGNEGHCRSFACPIAVPAYLNDLKRLDNGLYEQYKNSADKSGHIDSDWMIWNGETAQSYKDMLKQNNLLKSKLFQYETSMAQMRAALAFYADRNNYLGDIEIMTAKNDVSCIAQQALSTTPSQAVERQKRLIEAAKDVVLEWSGYGHPGGDQAIANAIDKLAAAIKEAE